MEYHGQRITYEWHTVLFPLLASPTTRPARDMQGKRTKKRPLRHQRLHHLLPPQVTRMTDVVVVDVWKHFLGFAGKSKREVLVNGCIFWGCVVGNGMPVSSGGLYDNGTTQQPSLPISCTKQRNLYGKSG